jgi:hypothetical protein
MLVQGDPPQRNPDFATSRRRRLASSSVPATQPFGSIPLLRSQFTGHGEVVAELVPPFGSIPLLRSLLTGTPGAGLTGAPQKLETQCQAVCRTGLLGVQELQPAAWAGAVRVSRVSRAAAIARRRIGR